MGTVPERRAAFEIDAEKRWRIWLLFGLLVALVFATLWVVLFVAGVLLALLLSGTGGGGSALTGSTWLFILRSSLVLLAVAVPVSVVYWFVSRIGARRRLLSVMHCRPLDPGDRYHQRLANIVDEMRIATGAPRIECFTVATLGLNAFAFSDLHGECVIGVTEGALARLSRQQLEGVVAYEFAHVLSGSCVTATAWCLLFGIYDSLGDEAVDDSGDEVFSAGDGARLGLRAWLTLFRLASSVAAASLNRQLERRADIAAARYTGDPLSLVEALRIVGRHSGGAGYIPEGLAPLCLRPSASDPGLSGRLLDTHPPMDERIGALLRLARVSPDDFAHQDEAAEDHFTRREHWSSPSRPEAAAPSLVAGVAAAAGPAAATAGAAPPAAATLSTGAGAETCPSCGEGLRPADYEGLDVLGCGRCGGRLVSSDQAGKILARREASFTDAQERLADTLAASGDRLRRAAVLAHGRPDVTLVSCPRCHAPMLRRHYDYDYAVEVDRCLRCDLIWFEKDELEALQILVERATG
jgi:Zn-dependent protease with chaperone function/Zn-finger nucleic acid-binding protein